MSAPSRPLSESSCRDDNTLCFFVAKIQFPITQLRVKGSRATYVCVARTFAPGRIDGLPPPKSCSLATPEPEPAVFDVKHAFFVGGV